MGAPGPKLRKGDVAMIVNLSDDESEESYGLGVKIKHFEYDVLKATWLYTVEMKKSGIDDTFITSLPEKCLEGPKYQVGDEAIVHFCGYDCGGNVEDIEVRGDGFHYDITLSTWGIAQKRLD